jgi:hypothetical protein
MGRAVGRVGGAVGLAALLAALLFDFCIALGEALALSDARA